MELKVKMAYIYKKSFEDCFKKARIAICIFLSIVSLFGLYQVYINYKTYLFSTNNYLFIQVFIFLISLEILFYFSIFLHELGHYLAIKRAGYQIKAFVAGPFVLINNDGHKLLRIRLYGVLTKSGFVLPAFRNKIVDQKSCEKCISDYINFLYGGAYATALLIIIGTLLIFFKSTCVWGLATVIINCVMLINLFRNDKNVLGDILLANLIKKDKRVFCIAFRNSFWAEFPINSYIVRLCEDFIEDNLSAHQYNESVIAILDSMLIYKIINKQELTKSEAEFKNWIFNDLVYTKCEDQFFQIEFIKLGYKFLLHEYALNKQSMDNYSRFSYFIKANELYSSSKLLKNIDCNIKELFLDHKNFDKRYLRYIHSFSSVLDGCENCQALMKEFIKSMAPMENVADTGC